MTKSNLTIQKKPILGSEAIEFVPRRIMSILKLINDHDFGPLGVNAFVAGGAAARVASYHEKLDHKHPANDYDIFLTVNCSEKDESTCIVNFGNFYINTLIPTLAKMGYRLKQNCTNDVLNEYRDMQKFKNKYVLSLIAYKWTMIVHEFESDILPDIQIITKTTDFRNRNNDQSMDEHVKYILDDFDFNACRFAFTNTDLYWTESGLENLRTRELTIYKFPKSHQIIPRIVKYVGKGYDMKYVNILMREARLGVSVSSGPGVQSGHVMNTDIYANGLSNPDQVDLTKVYRDCAWDGNINGLEVIPF